MQAFDRGLRCRTNALSAALRYVGAPTRASTFEEMPADDAQICNCNGVTKGAIVACVEAASAASRRDERDARRHGMRLVQARLSARSSSGPARAGRRGSRDALLRARRAADQAGADRARSASATCESVSAVFARAGRTARRIAASKPGLASLLKTLWGAEYEDERDARFINERVHANIQKDGTFSRRPANLRRRHHARRSCGASPTSRSKYQAPMVKITGGQRIDLLGHPQGATCRRSGATSACRPGTRTRRPSAPARPASARIFAATASATARRSASRSRRRFQGLEVPRKMKLATAGCPRNCSEATVKDVGAVAVEGGKWEIYVGGAAGSRVRKGDVLCDGGLARGGAAHDGPLHAVLPREREVRRAQLRLRRAIGIERIRAVVVDDAEGNAARLDREIEAAVAAYAIPGRKPTRPPNPLNSSKSFPAGDQAGQMARIMSQASIRCRSWMPGFIGLESDRSDPARDKVDAWSRMDREIAVFRFRDGQSVRDQQSMPTSGRSAQRRCRLGSRLGPRA